MAKAPPFAVRHVPIVDVKENPDNPRSISVDQFKRLVASVREFPQMLDIRPLVVDADMVVLGGNMRLKACSEAGLTAVPVVIADTLTPEQRREFVIKDNASFGAWDWDALANEWSDLPLADWGVDVPLMASDVAAEMDAIDANVDGPHGRCHREQVWTMGGHRLYVGDNESDTFRRLINHTSASDRVTLVDPPFDISSEKWVRWVTDPSIVFGQAKHIRAIPSDLWRFERVLVKPYRHRSATVQLDHRHAFVVQCGTKRTLPNNTLTFPSVVEFDSSDDSKHRHNKPVSLIVEHLTYWTRPWSVLIDPYAGGGSGVMSAEACGKVSISAEMDPNNAQGIIARWEAFTGEKAELLSEGEQ
jgi:hypothetical protein